MAGLIAKDLPAFTSTAERVAWAGERSWDIAEGILDKEDAFFVLWLVQGWADEPTFTDDDRRQFKVMLDVLSATIDLRFPSG